MLNPLRHLGGKLGHLHIPQTRYLRTIQLANSIRSNNQSKDFQNSTVESILALKSDSNICSRSYYKFQFDLQVHTQAAVYSLPSTVLDDPSPHQTKISLVVAKQASKLNARQLLYLNLALRKRINFQFPNWNNIHLSVESPSKTDLQMIPTLSATSRISQLKALPKKIVMKEVIKAKVKSA